MEGKARHQGSMHCQLIRDRSDSDLCASADQKAKVDAILKGDFFYEQLPRLRKRIVRLFICSITSERRLGLMREVYPKLQEYCRENYGVDFQILDDNFDTLVDTRHYVGTNGLCIKEIKECQDHCLGPNFMTFLGQRKVWHSLIERITKHDFEVLRNSLAESGDDASILDKWYREDENEIPAVHKLQPLGLNLGGSGAAEVTELLKRAATQATNSGQLQPGQHWQYCASDLEKQILEGIIKLDNEAERRKKCIVFVPEHNKDKLRSRLNDRVCFHAIDEEKDCMDSMENSSTSNLSAENILESDHFRGVNFLYFNDEEEDKTNDRNGSSSDRLSSQFYSIVRKLIDENMAATEEVPNDPLYKEALQHWTFAIDSRETFTGRDEIIDKVKQYIIGDTERVLVIRGSPGQGKSSVIAESAMHVNEWLYSECMDIKSTVILRLCGKTPQSSNIRQLLKGICHQIAHTNQKSRLEVPEKWSDVKQYFKDITKRDEQRGLVVIFLDALENLSQADKSHSLDWLPNKIANNMKIIVSVNSKNCKISENIATIVDVKEYHLNVDNTDPDLCLNLVTDVLNERGRSLTHEQWQTINNCFSHCTSLLFAKLIADQASMCKSFDDIYTPHIYNTVSSCISYIFDHLEMKHGQTVIRQSLGYLTASASGISDVELEHCLSIDDEVLNSVLLCNHPCTVHHFPPYIWARIRNDLEHYLIDHEAHETTVTFWLYKPFEEFASRRYLNDPDTTKIMHSTLADYYNGKWSGSRSKVYELGKDQGENTQYSRTSAARHVPRQPLRYTTNGETADRCNLRKLIKLPYHLQQSGRIEELLQNVFFNFDWLHAVISATSVQQLLALLVTYEHPEVRYIAQSIDMAKETLNSNANLLGLELSGRLLPLCKDCPHIRLLINQCDLSAMKNCPLVPNWQLDKAPGGPKLYSQLLENANQEGIILVEGTQSLLVATKPVSCTQCKFWDISLGEQRPSLALPSGKVYFTPDGSLIVMFKSFRYVSIYRTLSGNLCGVVEYGPGKPKHVTLTNRYLAFSTENTVSPTIIDIQARMVLHTFNYQSNVLSISKDDQKLIFSTDGRMLLYDLPLMDRKCAVQTNDEPLKILFVTDNNHFYVMSRSRQVTSFKFHPLKKTISSKAITRSLEIRDIQMSNSGKMLLVEAARELQIFNINTDGLKFTLGKLPDEVHVEPKSTFIGAGFSPDDTKLISSRHIYVCIWNTSDGQLMRILSSFQSTTRLFVPHRTSKIVTFTDDCEMHVWNLDQLESGIRYVQHIANGPIRKISLSGSGNKFVCFAEESGDAKIFDEDLGICTKTLPHNQNDRRVGCEVIDTKISFNSRYALTSIAVQSDNSPADLSEIKLWDLEMGVAIYQINNVWYSTFTNEGDVAVFIVRNSSLNYKIIVNVLSESSIVGIDLPNACIVDSPIIPPNGEWCACILYPNEDDYNNQNYPQLYVLKPNFMESQPEIRSLTSLCPSASVDYDSIHMRLFQKDKVIIMFNSKHSTQSEQNLNLFASAVVYDIQQDCVLKIFDKFLNCHASLSTAIISHNGMSVLDDTLHVHDIAAGSSLNVAKSVVFELSEFVLGGRYLATVSQERNRLHILRTSDGHLKVDVPVHGKATALAVGGQDERKVYVGCDDGRVLIFTVILELADPVSELISSLPSRNTISQPASLLVEDIVDTLHHTNKGIQHYPNTNHGCYKEKGGNTNSSVRMFPVLRQTKTLMKSQACVLQ